MELATVAILDDPIKVESELGTLDDLDLVWVGPSVEALMDALPQLRPQVLVLQLDHLGQAPITRAQVLATLSTAKVTIVTYAFARRYVLDAFEDESVRTVKEPMSPSGLRALVADGLGTWIPTGLQAGADTTRVRPERSSFGQLFLLESVPKSA